MFDAFKNDSSAWRNAFLFKMVIGLFSVFFACIGLFVYNNLVNSNAAQKNKIAVQEEWVKSFDYPAALDLEKKLGGLLSEKDVVHLINEKVDYCKENNIEVISVSTSDLKAASNNKKNGYKFVTSKLQLKGKWEDMIKVLNGIDSQRYMAVVGCNIKADQKNDEIIRKEKGVQYPVVLATIELVTYFKGGDNSAK